MPSSIRSSARKSFAKAGQLRVIAVTSKTRLPSMPDVPAVSETVPGYEFYSWYGLWGPAKLPPEIVAKLNTEVNTALATHAATSSWPRASWLAAARSMSSSSSSSEDMAKSQKIITEGNIRAE